MKLSEAVTQTPPKILLFGKAGDWKTTLATSWGSKTEIIDLDRGLLSALKLQDKFTSERHQVFVTPCYDVNPNVPSAFAQAKKRLYEISALCGTKTYDKRVLVLDSFTAFGEHAMRSIHGNSGKISALNAGKAQAPTTLPEWGLAINELENCLTVIKSLPIAVVVVAHEMVEDLEATKRVRVWALGSKLPDKMPAFFDEIWYSKVLGIGTDKKQVLQTQSTSSVLARSRGCLKDMTEASSLGLQELLKQIGYQ